MALNCSFCEKSFNKGEHLRRHERSHTGQRPFVCAQCKRSFSRQDSLLRHQKVHRGKQSQSTPGQSSSTAQDVDESPFSNASTSNLQTFESVAGPYSNSLLPNSAQNGAFSTPTPGMNQISHTINAIQSIMYRPSDFGYDDTLGLEDGNGLTDMDFSLIWPDSEDLFQSIFSTDLMSSWQLPPGTLPLPPVSPGQDRSGPHTGLNNISVGDSLSGQVPLDNHLQHTDGQPRSNDNQGAVRGLQQMVSNYSSSLTTAVESKSITSVFLDECLHMFFDRFIPIFPIMHRPTFVYRECSHSLLLNAIAIGSLYLGPVDSVAKGEALWRLAHTAVATSWQTLISHRGPYDACPGVQLVLSSLLSVVYGALSKSPTIRSASQALHASAFFWARQCGIFLCKPYDLADLPDATASHSEKMQQWKIWAAREIQQRALLSHFILDGLIAHFQGNSTSVRHTSNTLFLLNSERVFQETAVDGWLQRMHTIQQEPYTFRDIYKRLFDKKSNLWAVSEGCSNFSLRVLLEGLQSMIADSDPDDGAIVNPPNRSQIGHTLSWIYEKITTCSDISEVERLEVLMRWHAVCLEAVAKTPALCNYISKRWGAQQDLWPYKNLREHDYDLPKLVNSPDGRKALLHAIAIQNTIEQLPRGRAHAVHMPSSLFAAATIYGVYSFAGQTNVRMPSDVEWKDVVLTVEDLQGVQHETANFIRSNRFNQGPASTTSRNVLYELNSVQKLFRSLATQWGVSTDMEKVVSQWIALCHS